MRGAIISVGSVAAILSKRSGAPMLLSVRHVTNLGTLVAIIILLLMIPMPD